MDRINRKLKQPLEREYPVVKDVTLRGCDNAKTRYTAANKLLL